MQAHKLHQHLVGVRGAVKGTCSGAVIRRNLGGHQFVAPYFSFSKFLTNLALFIIW